MIAFPGLGLGFDIDRVAFTIFGLPIFWYGIIIGIAFAVGAFIVTRRAGLFGINSDHAMDAVFAAAILGIIGARVYFIIFSWEMYSGNLISIFHLRHGGLAFYGGVIGGIIGILLVCKWRKIKRLPLIDLFSSVVLLSLAIGRWGNFVNVEAFGSNTTAPWGMTGTAIVDYLTRNQHRLAELGMNVSPCTPVHPTFLYESLWNILVFVLIALYIKRRRFDGEITLLFFGLYGLGRAFIEGMRIDSLMLGNLRVSQGVAILCFVISAAVLIYIHSKIRKSGDPDYLVLHVNTVQAAALQAEESESDEPDTGDEQPQDKAEGNESGTGDEQPQSLDEPQLQGEDDTTKEETKLPLDGHPEQTDTYDSGSASCD